MSLPILSRLAQKLVAYVAPQERDLQIGVIMVAMQTCGLYANSLRATNKNHLFCMHVARQAMRGALSRLVNLASASTSANQELAVMLKLLSSSHTNCRCNVMSETKILVQGHLVTASLTESLLSPSAATQEFNDCLSNRSKKSKMTAQLQGALLP